MKIVFIQPKTGFDGHTWEALGIGYISAYLQHNSPSTHDIEFYSGFFDTDETIINACSDADIIGISCTSPQYKHGLYLAQKIKTHRNIIVFGGFHPTGVPSILFDNPCIDKIVVGEGEQSFLELVYDIENDNTTTHMFYDAKNIGDIDSIPFPDRVTIKNERNIEQSYKDNGTRITSVLSSRGCPYQCNFCSSFVVWGRKTRFRSPTNILDEIECLTREWNIQFLKFADDTFTLNKRRLIDFCKQKIERDITTPYGCNAHINTIDMTTLNYLAESNCTELWYGVESGSPKILKEMNKNIDLAKTLKAFRMTQAHGIKTRAYFLLGTPNETIKDINLTEQFCELLKPDIVGFTLLAPYPHTLHYDYKLMEKWDWSKIDEYNNDWVSTQTLTNKDLKREQQRLINKFKPHITYRQEK